MQDKEDVPIQSQREAKLGLAVASFQEVLVSSTRIIPTKIDDVTSRSFVFHNKNVGEDNGSRLPLVQEHQVLGKKFHCSLFC